MIFSACFLVRAMYNFTRLGRGAPIILSADLIVCYSLFLSCFVAALHQTVMDVDRMNSITAV